MKTYLQQIGMTLALMMVTVVGWGQTFYPSLGAINIEQNPIITITFDAGSTITLGASKTFYIEPYDANDLTSTRIQLFNGRNRDPRIIINNNILTLDLSGDILSPGVKYLIYTSDNTIFVNGTAWKQLDWNYEYWTFTTQAPPPPLTIVSYTPAPGSTAASTTDNLSITFSENIKRGTTGYLSIYLTGNGTFDDFNVSSTKLTISGATLTINPDPDFEYSTFYDILMDEGLVVSEATGVPCPAITDHNQWQFKTVDPPAPATTFNPANKTSGVEIYPTITITYDQAVRNVDGTEITNSNVESLIILKDVNNNIVSAANYVTTINSTKEVITIVVETALIEGIKYTIEVLPVENSKGQEQSATQTSYFYTESYNKWLGVTDDWETASNWSKNEIPSSGSSVIVQKSGSYNATISENTSIRNLIINADAALTIATGATLTLDNTLKMLSSADINASLLLEGAISVSPSNVQIFQKVSSSNYSYYISSPVNNPTRESIGSTIALYARDAQIADWAPLDLTDILTPATGYVTRSNSNLIFKGDINNGSSYAKTLYRTITPSDNFGWNLIGNPYPCSIDWLSTGITKTNINNAFWIWKNNEQRWATYNGTIEEGANVDGGYPSIIPSGHAFYTQVIKPEPNDANTSGSISISKTALTHNTVSYLKSSTYINKSVLRLESFNGDQRDEIVIALMEGAKNEFDPADSEKFLPKDYSENLIELYSKTGTTPCVINTFDKNAFSGSLSIPLGYRVKYASDGESYGIKLSSMSNFSEDTEVYLEDKLAKTNIKLSPSSHYCFESAGDTQDDGRFVLHLKSTSSTNSTQTQSTGIQVIAANKQINIYNTNGISYELMNINGQKIESGVLNQNTLNTLQIQESGIIVVKIITPDRIITNKVLIN